MRHATHIVLVGPMGSGKSAIGQRLAQRLQRPFVDVDAAIEAASGHDIPEIFAREGEAGFRVHEALALANALNDDASVIATGGGAVLEASNRAAMRAAGTVVYLQVDPVTQLARLADDANRPLLQVEDRAQRLAQLQAQREPLYREVAHIIFDTSTLSAEAAAAAVAKRIIHLEATQA